MINLLKNIRKLLPALVFYFLGMGGLLVADIFISATAQEDTIAFWAFVKSILFISSTLCILGVDQAIVRYPAALLSNYKIILLQVFVISLVLSSFFSFTNTTITFTTIAPLIFLTAILSLLVAFTRGANQFNIAQVSLNGWKFLFLLFLLFLSKLYIDNYVFWSALCGLLLGLIISLVLVLRRRYIVDFYIAAQKKTPVSFREFRLASLQLFLLMISLNLSVNIEQLLLNFTGQVDASANLFAHFAVFMPIMLFANGFTGFVLGPYLRENVAKILHRLPFLFVGYFCVGMALLVGSFVIGQYFFDYFYGDKFQLQNELIIFTLMIGLLRFLYIIPSSFVTIVASPQGLRHFTILGVVGLCIAVLTYFVTVSLTHVYLWGILLASALNWSIRTFGGIVLTVREYNAMRLNT